MNLHTVTSFVPIFNKRSLNPFSVKMKGFTLLEILLVVGTLAILMALILPSGLDLYKRQQLDSHTQGIIQALRRAQLKAMSVESDSSFGVYLTNDNYTLFKGDSYVSDDIYNEVFDLPQIITITGLSEVVFSKFEGEPNSTGDIILTSNNQRRIINVYKFGKISLVSVPSLPHLVQVYYRWRNDDGGE